MAYFLPMTLHFPTEASMIYRLAFSLILFSSSICHAGVISTRVGGSDGVTVYEDQHANNQAVPGAAVRSHAEGSSLSDIFTDARASFGVLKSTTTLGTANPMGGGTSWAISRWEDTVKMENASLTGQRATATIRFVQTYMLDTITYPDGWRVQSLMSDNVFVGAYSATYIDEISNWGYGSSRDLYLYTYDFRGATTTTPTNTKFIDLVVDFVWGDELRIGAQLQASCVIGSAATSLYGGCTADAGHSSYWGGIASIVDASGKPITSYSLISGSGTDYSRSMAPMENDVPEPATLLLVILGGMLFAITPRRRR